MASRARQINPNNSLKNEKIYTEIKLESYCPVNLLDWLASANWSNFQIQG